MADFTALKTAIQTYIKQNGNEEITGEVLQTILLSIVNTLGDSAINDLITTLNTEVADRQNADSSLEGAINQEGTLRSNADSTLQGNINAEATARQNADAALQAAIDLINSYIPAQASSSNKLADKDFVNSSIATATATFRGTYNVVSDLSLSYNATHAQIQAALVTKMSALSITPDNNDYAFVQIPTSDATPTQIAKTEKYKYNGSAWAFEYVLNNSGFTAAQWAAINSGATLELIGKLSALPTNAQLIELLNDKVSWTDNGAYDVTAHNSGATFASLSALLNSENLDTLIPTDIRRGGMSVKFVQSSDNKYVQYRLMADTFSTTESDWQGVDDEPTEGSENLVKSGGVYKTVGGIGVIVEKKNISVSDGTAFNGFIKTDKTVVQGQYWTTSTPIYCPKDTLIIAYTAAEVGTAPIARVAEDLSVVYDICVSGEGGSAKKYIFLTEVDGWYCCRGTNVHIITSDGYIKEIVNNLRNEIENGIVPSSRVADPNTGEKVEDTINAIGVHYSKLDLSLENGMIGANGSITGPNDAFRRTKYPFQCRKGDLIKVTCSADTAFAVVAKVNEAFTEVEKVCVIGTTTSTLYYTYLVEQDGYYACSSYRTRGLMVELITSDNYIEKVVDEINLRISSLPSPNTADFSLTDWQTKIPMCYLFHNPVFCGDSTYAGGTMSYANENYFNKVLEDYSMPAAVGRILSGWNVTNVSKSAIKIKDWITTYFLQADFQSHDLAIMGFGWNEPTPTTTIDEDVNQWEGDYTKYADTLYGNYCKLVEMAKEVNPNIYIVFTIPVGLNRTNQARVDAINIIAAKYNIPVINLCNTTYMTVPVSTRDYIHNSPAGYIKSAQFIVASFARICESRIIEIDNTIYAANT